MKPKGKFKAAQRNAWSEQFEHNFLEKGKNDEEVRNWYEAPKQPARIPYERNGGSGSRNFGCVSVARHIGGIWRGWG